mgnify:CR=1 FL=1
MIFLFRKEIKKWNTVWWVVLASLAFSGGAATFFMKSAQTKDSIKVAIVNGKKISLKDFHHVYAHMKAALDDWALYFGVSADQVSQMFGAQNLEESALQTCVNNKLLDGISFDFNMRLDQKYFIEELGNSVSSAIVDQTGRINMDAYQRYLSRFHMSVSDFEESKEGDFKRNQVKSFMEASEYLSENEVKELFEHENVKKNFFVAVLPFDYFVKETKKNATDTAPIEVFFKKNKANYCIGEKRKAQYWILTAEEYAKKIIVDDKSIENFYERNKFSLYRIPPKVKIRTIVFSVPSDASPDVVISAERKAKNIYKRAIENPDSFAKLANEYSQDKTNPGKGGLLDFFSRGTYDPELERVAFLVLKEKGEISEIIKTKRGFEIIKLEDRVLAKEKSLENVRDDIIKTLKKRKSITSLKGDLEVVIRKARSNKDEIVSFAQKNKLTTNKTNFLYKDETSDNEIVNELNAKIFSQDGKNTIYGYFAQKGKHILYVVTDTQKSFIPDFNKIEEDVTKDYYEEQAEKLQKETLNEVRQKALQGLQLNDICKEYNFKLIKTKKVTGTEKVDELKDAGQIIEKAVALTDPKQVLLYKHDRDNYLVQLREQDDFDIAKYQKARKKIIQDEKVIKKRLYYEAFIASLKRNARIEIYKNLINTYVS